MKVAGGCHCGSVRFEADVADAPRLLDCNCSICAKSGYLHLIVAAADFRLVCGEERLVDYRFGTGAARHRFCGTCGIKSFYHPRSHPDDISINARTLDDEAWRTFAVEPFNGRDWEAARARLPD